MKLNVNMYMLIKNMKCVESNAKIVSAILNTQTVAKNSNRYEYMDDWKKFNETSPGKEQFTVIQIRKVLRMQITRTKKEFLKIVKLKI